MGATSSVIKDSRAAETSLLRLYNRQRRDDRDSKRDILKNCVEYPKCPQNAEGKACSTKTVGCRETSPRAYGRATERTRVRERMLIQMYNSNLHADLGAAVESLKESLRQCAIDGTRWATVVAVSAVLAQAGVTLEDPAILLLGARGTDTDNHHAISAQTSCRDGTAISSVPLVCWPNIIESLEEGPFADVENVGTLPARGKILDSSATQRNSIPFAGKEDHDHEPKMSMRIDSKFNLPGARKEQLGRNPEVTPESEVVGDGGPCNISGSSCEDRQQESAKGMGGWNTSLQQGLRNIDEGLREVEHHGVRLCSQRIQETMRSIREILTTQTGKNCERPAGRHKLSHPDERDQRDEADELKDPPEVLNSPGMKHQELEEFAERLIVEKLDLAEHVDLKSSDAFGRNALYYSCLCGHVRSVHFIVVNAYGGIEGIPEKEHWECRKNALSAEIRQYLDTGILVDATRGRALKSEEERPAQVPPAGGKFNMVAPRTKCSGKGEFGVKRERGSCGADRELHEAESTVSGAQSAEPSEEVVVSVASLFGEAVDRGNNEDY